MWELTGTVTGLRATMMSHFGHEAIFTLDYTINENQMFDCLMPGQREDSTTEATEPPTRRMEPLGKCCNFAKVSSSVGVVRGLWAVRVAH